MADAIYKLSCILYGHGSDVRAITSNPDNFIISVSRDRTTKIWKPNCINTGYTEIQTLTGHTSFVNCVTYMPPNLKHKYGLIITGSNDSTILVYDARDGTLIYTLKGHSNSVVVLKIVSPNSTLLSGSWDHTAKLWTLDGSTVEPLRTLSGHLGSVLAVLDIPHLGLYITGSSDKTLKVWGHDGSKLHTAMGHDDVVRDLINANENQFFSTSNDCTVRLWHISETYPSCIGVYAAHNNFIYSLSLISNENEFVIAGEGGGVNICKHGDIFQSLTLPAESVWSVCVIPNGDIVTGSSDGIIRVFTKKTERQADPDLLAKFDEEVKAFTQKPKEIEGIDVNKLPGQEALAQPGKHEGATVLVVENGKPVCYMWKEGKWEKIGEVTGTNAESQGRIHNGKEYDYVFKVDIEEGKPPLTLPYNVSEDPWLAAQNFIHENNLSQGYLDQVANFIMTNSKRPNITQPETNNQGFIDPFTGDNRYIPGGSTSNDLRSAPQTDPFTGNSRYTPNQSNKTTVDIQPPKSFECFFPQKFYLRFDQANLKGIYDKLNEFNQRLPNNPISEEDLKKVVNLSELNSSVAPESIAILKELLKWPKDLVFPVLDIIRLAIRNTETNKLLCGSHFGTQLIEILRQYLNSEAPISSQMLALRIASNMLSQEEGESLALKHCEYLLMCTHNLSEPFSKNVEIAVSTLLLNLVIALEKQNNEVLRKQALLTCNNLLLKLKDNEAQFRGLIAFGTLLTSKYFKSDPEIPSPDAKSWLTSLTASESCKVSQCAIQLLAYID